MRRRDERDGFPEPSIRAYLQEIFDLRHAISDLTAKYNEPRFIRRTEF